MELFLHYLSFGYLLQGIILTLGVTAIGLSGGLGLGALLAAMQMSRNRWLSGFARGYAIIFRGTPLILQMVFAYDALPHIGVRLSPLMAAGLALAANEAPFIAEMLRAGIRGIDPGQVAAGRSLGMSSSVLMRRIIAPQATRVMIPAFGNEAVSALKNSSLASIISVQELTLRSTQLASSTFDFFSIFFASGLVYLLLTGAVSGIQLIAEYALDLDRTARRRGKSAHAQPNATAETQASDDVSDLVAAEGGAVIPLASRQGRPAPLRGRVQEADVITVEVKGLSKHFGNQVVFKELDLTVRAGEVVALLGPSGSGKSTLLRCINRLEEWDSGEVRIGGRRVGFEDDGTPLAPNAIARQRAKVGVGMVFQQFNLFDHLTALENIAGPLRWVQGWPADKAEQRARELLERVGLTHRADALPRHLSGGQQQRVAIARVLAPRPNVLLLDEPTSALDPELVNEVLEVIQKLSREDRLTMIIATHQLRFAKEVAHRVVFLSHGVVTEEGTAEQVLTNPKHPLTARFLRVMGANHDITS